MDDEKGMTLFQDVEKIKFNFNDEQNDEEDEDQEEREKREEEIENCLAGYFDESNSIDSSHDKESTQCSEDISVNTTSSKFHSAVKNKTPICNNYNNDGQISNIRKDSSRNAQISPCNNYAKYNHGMNNPFDQHMRDQIYNTPSSRYSDQIFCSNNGHIDQNNDCIQTHGNHSDEILHTTNYLSYPISINDHKIESLEKILNQREEEINALKRELQLQQEKIEKYGLYNKELQQSLENANAEKEFLQSQAKALQEGNKVQQNTIEELSENLSVSKAINADLEKKIDILESVQSSKAKNDKINEQFLKQTQDKYAMDLKNKQNEIDQLLSSLKMKETSYNILEEKFENLRRKYDALALEDIEKVNNLKLALKECQTQCQNLASKNKHEFSRLQSQLDVTLKEKAELLHKVEDLEHKLILAHNDEMQCSSLLRQTNDDQSDSIQQMNLGSAKAKSNSDDMVTILRWELNRSLKDRQLKQKEIVRLQNTLVQKQQELDEALQNVNSLRQEVVELSKRNDQLESDLKSLLSDKAKKAYAKIQKLSDHLTEVKKQNESLRKEKQEIETKLEETLSQKQELSTKLYQTTVNDEEISSSVMNQEYLAIQEKAVQQIKREAELKRKQLEEQLEETQKYLNSVKQSYIDVCDSKEQLVKEHKQEIKALKEKYENFEIKEQLLEKSEQEVNKQMKIIEKLSNDCEKYRNKIIELEKDIELEKRKRPEHARLIHMEIEKAKEEALTVLRNAHPNHNISVHLPDYCSSHMDRITELENNCKLLEEKYAAAEEDRKKLSEIQAELDVMQIKLARTEINKEAWIKKYETTKKEINKIQTKYDEILAEKNACQEKLTKLEQELADAKHLIESSVKGQVSAERSDLDNEISRLKNKVVNCYDDNVQEHVKQLENDLKLKEDKLKELEKVKEERDILIKRLENQARQFKQFLKNQKQVSAELSSSCVDDSAEVQKIKEVREEMEQKVKEKLKEIEDNHQTTLKNLRKEYNDKSKELESLKESTHTERLQLQASFQKQEQKIIQIQARISEQLLARKLQIEELQEKLAQKESDIDKERNVMAQLLSNWSMELKVIQNREKELQEKYAKLKNSEESLAAKVKSLSEEKKEIDSSLKAVKKKYRCVKKIAVNYKEHAEKKDKRFRNECRRIEESYKKTMAQVQQKVDTIISVQDKEMAKKLREVEVGYAESLKKLRIKYKHKC